MAYSDWEKVPIIGDWIGKFGQVQDIMATPCDVDPEIWVLAFFNGLPAAAFTLLKPEPFDAATERFGNTHKRRRRRRFRFNELLVRDKPPTKGLTWVVFKVGSWAERIGWYMLVIDIGFEWAVNWSSMAYQWSGCANPNASWGWLACTRTSITANNAFWAGWESTNSHGKITTDDYRVIAMAPVQASPYLEIEISPPGPGFPFAEFIEFEIWDTNSGWKSDPVRAKFEGASQTFTYRHVWRDFIGNPEKPAYALYFRSDGKYWSMKAKLGLNGEPARGITFDP